MALWSVIARDEPDTPTRLFVPSSACQQTQIPSAYFLTSAMKERFLVTCREDRCPGTNGPYPGCCAENASRIPTRWTSCATPLRIRTCTLMLVAHRFAMPRERSLGALSCSVM